MENVGCARGCRDLEVLGPVGGRLVPFVVPVVVVEVLDVAVVVIC